MENKPLDTEEKIKQAARVVFTQKGYAATRTRDIAQEAGINLSLLNYYFRSKEKLFNIIMTEKIQQFFGVMFPVINDETLSLEIKIEQFVTKYIDLLQKNPDLPIFVLSEIRSNPKHLVQNLGIKKILVNSSIIKQLQERRPDLNPVHFVINLLGMTVFPFVAKPVLVASEAVNDTQFDALMEERKTRIPFWMHTLLETK